jgi:thiamine pyrophosphokinase
MKQAIIFANGELNYSPTLINEIQPDDLIIAADGGAIHCRRLGIRPHVVIGDFDSLRPEDLVTLEAEDAQLIRYPSHKDETDLELAFRHAAQQGCRQITVIGALGARWDMSVANILLAAYLPFEGMQVRLLDGHQELTLLHAGETLTMHGEPGDTLSLIPLTARAEGISTHGLEYALKDEDLQFGSPRGVSNVFTAKQANITLRRGMLMCVVIRNGGIE